MYRGRSENLVELRDALASGEDGFAVLLGNFLDQFYSTPTPYALVSEPRLLVGAIENGEYYDAYLAAIAEFLAIKYGLATPEWAGELSRFLSSPRINMKNKNLRELLVAECPAPFKRRGVIVGCDALARA